MVPNKRNHSEQFSARLQLSGVTGVRKIKMKSIPITILFLFFVGCTTTYENIDTGPYARATKTITRKMEVDLGDGQKREIKKSEIDIEDYIALINSVPIKELDKQPLPLAVPAPFYPPNLLKEKIVGEAEIFLTVAENGFVKRAVVNSATHKEFGIAAVTAVMNWRFQPMTKNGKPVEVTCRQVFRFRL